MIGNKLKVWSLTYVSFCSRFIERKTSPLETLAFLSEALKGKARLYCQKFA